MSDHDPLPRAIEALRAETPPTMSARDRETEDAIIRKLSLLPKRRTAEKRRSFALIPLAAILFGSSAWAIVSPESPLREFFPAPFSHSSAPPPKQEQPAGKSTSRTRAQAPADQEDRSMREGEVDNPPSQENPERITEREQGRPRAPVRGISPGAPADRTEAVAPGAPRLVSENERPAARESTRPDRTAAELALYQSAHKSQFHERNLEAALAGWDSYLAEYPTGTLALEARYHRALCLFTLGRPGARRALEPFARGDYGIYRRAEAERMIQKLDERASGSPAPPPP